MEKIYRNGPPVFVLEILSNGYGVARSLSRWGIDVVGFIFDTNNVEMSSRLPKQIVYLTGDEYEQFEVIKRTAAQFAGVKPVLISTSDRYHVFISKFYEQLKELFVFEMPSFDNLLHFLEKDLFNEIARTHGILIPLSIEVTPETIASQISSSNLSFPVIIKPKYRDQKWIDMYDHTKAFVAEGTDELYSVCQRAFNVCNRMVVQEWIPGPDSNIYFCLAYITQKGEVLDYFCGQKINQYPILLGNTSSAIASDNPDVVKEALRIMTLPGIYGFCSVEFKKHFYTGKYYVIEPTIGRINRQEFCATLNGSHLITKAYCHLANIPFVEPTKKKNNNCLYVEEIKEMRAIAEHRLYGSFNWRQYLGLLVSKRIGFMYMNRRDLRLSFRVLEIVLRIIVKDLLRKKANKPKPSEAILRLIATYQQPKQ